MLISRAIRYPLSLLHLLASAPAAEPALLALEVFENRLTVTSVPRTNVIEVEFNRFILSAPHASLCGGKRVYCTKP